MGKTVLATIAPLAVAMTFGLVHAGQTKETAPPDRSDTPIGAELDERDSEREENYLGVALAPVPPALVAQLPGILGEEQGVVVVRVMPDSPASKAGIRVHDIIVSYNDRKVHAPDQLAGLVRGDEAKREVELGVVRSGRLQNVRVKLGQHTVSYPWLAPRPRSWFFRLPRGFYVDPDLWSRVQGDKSNVWSSSSSLSLKSLEEGRFRAEIEYKDSKGNTQSMTLEGTREEIRKSIEEQKELPDSIRQHLLRSLDLQTGQGFGPFRFGRPGFPRPGVWFDFDEDFWRFGFPEGFWQDFDRGWKDGRVEGWKDGRMEALDR